ncbi:MAG: PEP-CTERM sorting domain-containing protein [Phycisphaerae bacterium]|nr:PEP-CTERM sorting domain-containing protein [Phycisphaerae bacterium]
MGKVLVAGLLTVLLSANGAFAGIVNSSLDFNGSGDSAVGSLAAYGNGSMTASGTVYVKILAWWVPINVSFSGTNLILGTDPDMISLASDPTGTGSVGFETASPVLSSGTLNGLNVDIKDGAAWNMAMDRIELTESGGLSKLYLDASGSIDSYRFDMTGAPTGTYLSGGHPSVTYEVSPSGNLSASYSAHIDGSFSVGVTFMSKWYAFDIPVGTMFSLGGSVDLPATAEGTMTLTELAGDYPRDVAVELELDAGPISIPFSATDSFAISKAMSGSEPYYNITGNYDFSGLFQLGSTHVSLTDTIVGVVPEPVTLSVLGLGGALLALRRRRAC